MSSINNRENANVGESIHGWVGLVSIISRILGEICFNGALEVMQLVRRLIVIGKLCDVTTISKTKGAGRLYKRKKEGTYSSMIAVSW